MLGEDAPGKGLTRGGRRRSLPTGLVGHLTQSVTLSS
jgi:hypothetical protein